MELHIMYPPQKDSPTTFLMGAILSTDTFAIVGNVRLLPSNLPFPLTLGPDKPITEVVMVTEIDTESNRIVFERGSGALPWVAGTTVGRVFNASDLKTVQDNIIGINQEVDTVKNDILDLKEDVSDLTDVVGDSEGGLVKDLEDEIARAMNAEAAEVLRATAAEGTLETKKVDRSDLPQVLTDTSYSADATKLTNTLTRYNASTKVTTTYDRFIPLITPESVGLMTPEAYNEITALRNDVGALQQQGGRFIGISFATKAALDGYEVPSSVKLGDFTYVLDDEEHEDSTTRYVFDGNKFDFAFVVNYDPVGLADDTTAGLVKSTDGTVFGKIFVETDGTMSLVGWDETLNDVLYWANDNGDYVEGTLPLDADLLGGQGPSYYATKTFVDGLGGTGRTTETVKGNADALVAYKADMVNRGFIGDTANISGTDLNNLLTTGFYSGHNLVNAPTASYYYVEVMRYSGTMAKQTITQVTGTDAGVIWERVRDSSWKPWYNIITNKPIPWINATLENGWTGTLKYRVNTFKQLEIIADINAGTVENLIDIARGLPRAQGAYLIPAIMMPDGTYNGRAVYFSFDGRVRIPRSHGLQSAQKILFSACIPLY